jgi:hypothetical protein
MKLSSTKKMLPRQPAAVKAVQFREHLPGRLHAHPMAEKRGHVAKIAVERTSPGELNAHGRILFHARQAPVGNRGPIQAAETRGPVDALERARLQVRKKMRQREFGLVEHQMIHLRERLRFRREQRTARNHLQPPGPTALDDFLRRSPLNGHSPDEDHLRPREIVLPQILHIDIHQPRSKFVGQHGGHREQAQGRIGRFLPDELQGVFEAPEGIGVCRVDQQYVHRRSLPPSLLWDGADSSA